MKNLLIGTWLLLSGILILACQPDNKKLADDAMEMETENPATTAEDSVKRGEHLSHIMGCHDCHSPKMMTDQGPVPDPSKLLSGHPASESLPAMPDKSVIAPGQWMLFNGGLTAAVGPWGTSFAANLTPHATGTGNWTLENFEKALRHGKSKGLDNGRMLLPPMPWPNYINLSDEDLANLWHYIRSLPPIDNVVPAPLPPA